jgi:DNA-binding beta-propeller fold protein YncE
MSALYPESQSPASFRVGPMPQTKELPTSAMRDAARDVSPQSIGTLQWTRVAGSAAGLAVAPDGSLWALSSSGGGVNKSIWHYASGTWTNISGSAASIAIGSGGTLYAVNGTTGGVYAYNGTSWSSLGGGARWVTTGADGAVYVLSNAHVVNGNSAIWKYASGAWTQQPGSGSQLVGSFDPNAYAVTGVGSISPNGYFVLNSSGGIYYYSPGTGYVHVPGSASGLAPATGGLFALGYPPSASGEGLFYFDYGSAGWTAKPGSGVSVAAGAGAGGTGMQLDIINAAYAIWTAPVVSTGPAKFYITNAATGELTTYTLSGTQSTPTITGFTAPWGVAVDASGKIHVANLGNGFSGTGSVTSYTATGTPTSPTITGLDYPFGLAVDASGKIYVANYGNNTVTTYSADGTPTAPTISTGLNEPSAVAVDSSGKIYVANFGGNSVTTYTAGGVQTTPTITAGVNHPHGVAVDSTGKIYVTNAGSSTLTSYMSNGTQTAPTIVSGLDYPFGVAVDAAGNIYVTNSTSNTLMTYSATGSQTAPTIAGLGEPTGLAIH